MLSISWSTTNMYGLSKDVSYVRVEGVLSSQSMINKIDNIFFGFSFSSVCSVNSRLELNTGLVSVKHKSASDFKSSIANYF